MFNMPACPFSIITKGTSCCTTEINASEKCYINNDKYKGCHFYNIRRYEDTLPFPQICPLVNECHKEGETFASKCEEAVSGLDPTRLVYEQDFSDYRKCPVFSKWFWERKVKGGRKE